MTLARTLVFLAATLGLFVVGARAQVTPPEGNAHPARRMVEDAPAANPFGNPADPVPASREGTLRKLELAAAVDLEPLRDLAVFHNGRVKVLDTLARETVREITGRRDYFEVVDGRRVRFDPLFTLLDLMIDPGFYAERPLIGVEYFPLRREFVERAVADTGEQDHWLTLLRISPAMYARHAQAIANDHMNEPAYREALGRVDQAIRIWDGSVRNLRLVAPPSPDLPWKHVSELEPSHPARGALLDLGRAWREGDTEGINRQVRLLAETLPTINPEVYPGARRELEMLYNRVNAFEWGAYAYFAALLAMMLAFGTGRRWLVGAGVALLIGAIALHGFGFVIRCIIAERFAIQNQFESMTGLSLFGAVVGLALAWWRRQWIFGAAAAGMGFLVLLAATQTGIPGVNIEREAAILNTSVLLKYHVTTVLVSYGLITLGFIVALFYLGAHYFRRGDVVPLAQAALASDEHVPAGRERTLADLDRAHMTILQLAFWTLGVGILLGAWWADHSWGRWWAWDPKETWALITWIVYLIVVHVRVGAGRHRGLVTAWLSVVGFFVMLWTYFGVNLLLPGLHAYA
jgi:cytochrome c-type biogenesis protein CcsB